MRHERDHGGPERGETMVEGRQMQSVQVCNVAWNKERGDLPP